MTGPRRVQIHPLKSKDSPWSCVTHESNESSISLLSHVSGYPSMLDTLYVSRHIISDKAATSGVE